MYYGHMTKEEIKNSSRPFLYGIYKSYCRRACENLGVSPDVDNEENEDKKVTLRESDYPKEFKKLTQKEKEEREKYSNTFDSNEDFLSQFPMFNADKYTNPKMFEEKKE